MNEIARKAAEKCPVKTNADVDKCEAIIQAAIEEAIAQANESFKPFFEDVEYKSDKELEQIISQSDDTKRLDFWLRICGDGEHSHVVFLDRQAIDAAMQEGK